MQDKGYTLEEALKEVGPGWAPLVRQAFAALPPEGKITTVKAKFGGLRIYADGIPFTEKVDGQGSRVTEFYTLLDKLELESLKTCEDCGAPGVPTHPRGWIRTLCRPCGAAWETRLGVKDAGTA